MVKLTETLVLGKTRVDSLKNVKNLNLWGQTLSDISILQEMVNVEVVSMSVNNINSLKDFENCNKLTELYLRKNDIADLTEVAYIKHLPFLKVLWLCGNPCADVDDYRLKVISVLEKLEKLDDQGLI
jgi:Leucine-rich repeat (LRR) protein